MPILKARTTVQNVWELSRPKDKDILVRVF
jgi:hypothetical protein